MAEFASVVVEGCSRVSEADREAFLTLVKDVVRSSATRPGCLKFSVAEDILERNLFHLAELWTDRAALDASRFGHENHGMLQKFAALDVRDRKVLVYDVASAEAG